jgi:hypothetical protein
MQLIEKSPYSDSAAVKSAARLSTKFPTLPIGQNCFAGHDSEVQHYWRYVRSSTNNFMKCPHRQIVFMFTYFRHATFSPPGRNHRSRKQFRFRIIFLSLIIWLAESTSAFSAEPGTIHQDAGRNLVMLTNGQGDLTQVVRTDSTPRLVFGEANCCHQKLCGENKQL